jgi:cytochrome c-type biogenesis protein CcmF
MVTLGYYSLLIALFAAGWSIVGGMMAFSGQGRGFQRSAERGILAATAMIIIATIALEHGFLTDNFALDYVYHYSSTTQPIQYKIGALWGGQAGSLLLWVLILGVISSVMVFTNKRKNRALMPVATAVVGVTITFFLVLLNFVENPFNLSAMRPDGVGLNPQLKNYWMMIHPPCLYLGYVGFTIPFAFGMAALATRRTGDTWFRTTRRWTLFSWFFLGIGILLGSYWAYIELGWGGYWAWDPVENASLMPWLTGTAFLHSVMIQEKKGMLKIWNMSLIILTFSLSIFGTFLTRSGIISSVHSFATSGIGPAFGVFLGIVFFGSLILLGVRMNDLKSKARLESFLSRETTFLFNNLIFVGIALTVLFLTTFPMISELATGRKVTMGPEIFNTVNIPWALLLLLLTGVGPLIAWRKASKANLTRNFKVPLISGGSVLLVALILDRASFFGAVSDFGSSLFSLNVQGMFEALKGIYPALTFGIGAFVVGTMILEFVRGTRVRRKHHSESVATAAFRLVWGNKRRYGGYIVHMGMVVIFIGIAGSSAYRSEKIATLLPGESMDIAGYSLRYDSHRLEAIDDYYGATVRVTAELDGKYMGTLAAEQRYHPNRLFTELTSAFDFAKSLRGKDDVVYQNSILRLYTLVQELEPRVGREVKTPSTEVAILPSTSLLNPSRLGEDLYVIPLWVNPVSGQANFRVFVNPMVNFLWFGGFIVIFGAHLCVLPDTRERKRLEAYVAQEERAIA